MSKYEVEKILATGAAPYVAGQNTDLSFSGAGKIDLWKSHVLFPITATTAGTSGYIDNVLALFEDKEILVNDQSVESVREWGLLMSAYTDKLVSRGLRNSEGVSRFGQDMRTVVYSTAPIAPTGAMETASVIRESKWVSGTEVKYAVPLGIFFQMAGGYLPLYNSLRWRLRLKLRSNVTGLVASSGSPVYSIGQPTLVLHREVDEAETQAFNRKLSQGVDLDYLSILHSQRAVASGTAFTWDFSINQKVDGELFIPLLDADDDQDDETMTKFDRNGITSARVQYPSGQRLPKSGDFDCTEANGVYEMYEPLKNVKAILNDYSVGRDDFEPMQVGTEINGLLTSSDRDFMLAFEPRTRENGVATLTTAGSAGASGQMHHYVLSKAKINVSPSGVVLKN